MNTQETIRKTGNFIRTSVTLKMISIGILVLVLLIPTAMISSLRREREARRDAVVQEINQKWGNRQTLTGPFFTVPYKSFYKDKNDKRRYSIRYFHILPEKLHIKGDIASHIRYRSMYEAVVYHCQLEFSGVFTVPRFNQLNIAAENILWEKSIFSVGMTDMRGIKESIHIAFGEKNYTVNPGLKTKDIADAGVSSLIPLASTDRSIPFSFKLTLNGSDQIQFTPLGEETTVAIHSDWASPSFNGAFLPVERTLSENGFTATWKILHLNRNFPQYWEGGRYHVNASCFGFKFLITADVYQKATRVSKYAILFVIFTFSAFFFAEIINKNRVHPIQYLLIGLAVILFYILQLSLSEHVNFDAAYLISATAITLVISGYTKGFFKKTSFTLTVFSLLTILYLYLYIVLQLEDYALIMGSVGLFVVLATVMFVTRKIDWYAVEKDTPKA
ncbi:MAG: cell envelope integrity protein CreD [Deltaproteobacteria bacterium]|nr:MAG: cell envelope integrity protein CreD [Deltaproteobacteria bacterium]